MTTPNSDAPVASVPFGPSEIAVFITLIASFCNATFGHDYGLSKNTQAISAAAVALLPIGLGVFRAIKHHGAMSANALVLAKQIEAGVGAVQTARHGIPASVPPAPAVVPHPLDGAPASSDL